MKNIFIKEKLKQIGVSLEDIPLGDFDQIGEFTAKKNRSPTSELYNKVGCFFRPNYERGILQYYLTKKFKFSSVLEIGFGRGYSTLCLAKAMCDLSIPGKITTVDPNLDKDFLEYIFKILPNEWFSKINCVQMTSEEYYKTCNQNFDFIYIDGDHRYDAVKKDWEFAKDHFDKFVLFDDYHMPTKSQKDIECSKLIDEIEGFNKELIIMDRRIFYDDRRVSDDLVDYGQVLLSKGEN